MIVEFFMEIFKIIAIFWSFLVTIFNQIKPFFVLIGMFFQLIQFMITMVTYSITYLIYIFSQSILKILESITYFTTIIRKSIESFFKLFGFVAYLFDFLVNFGFETNDGQV